MRIEMSTQPGTPMRAIDQLKRAANLKPVRKVVVLNDGTEMELFHKPLTMAARERAQKNAKSDDAGAFALQLLVEVAKNSEGEPMFSPGEIADLKHQVRDEDLQKLMLAILQTDEEADEEAFDLKRAGKATGSGQ
jgi:hypothetical protein